jgi:cytochrome b involved in lipid metabolism
VLGRGAEFVANHPGGSDKIMMAAGAAIDPFWNLYRQHLNRSAAALSV